LLRLFIISPLLASGRVVGLTKTIHHGRWKEQAIDKKQKG
jgi:hypothetical protein